MNPIFQAMFFLQPLQEMANQVASLKPLSKKQVKKKKVSTTSKKTPLTTTQRLSSSIQQETLERGSSESKNTYACRVVRMRASIKNARFHLHILHEIERADGKIPPLILTRVILIRNFATSESVQKLFLLRVYIPCPQSPSDHLLFSRAASNGNWLYFSHKQEDFTQHFQNQNLLSKQQRKKKKAALDLLPHGKTTLSQYTWFSGAAPCTSNTQAILGLLSYYGQRMKEVQTLEQIQSTPLIRAMERTSLRLSNKHSEVPTIPQSTINLQGLSKQIQENMTSMQEVIQLASALPKTIKNLSHAPTLYCSVMASVQHNILAQAFHICLEKNKNFNYQKETVRGPSGGRRPIKYCHDLCSLWKVLKKINPTLAKLNLTKILPIFNGDFRYPHTSLAYNTNCMIQMAKITRLLEKIDRQGEKFTPEELEQLKQWFPNHTSHFKTPLLSLQNQILVQMVARTQQSIELAEKILTC